MASATGAVQMTGEVIWTVASYAAHNEAMRVAERELQTERDRRYAEVNVEKEKALKIKETADLTALELARESQVYKDERNDAMREQNLKETGVYATRDDLALLVKATRADLALVVEKFETALQPLADYITSQQGGHKTSQAVTSNSFKVIAAISSILAILGVFVAVVMAVMK